MRRTVWLLMVCLLIGASGLNSLVEAEEFQVTETADEIKIESSKLEAAIRKKGYVSGVKAQSFLDKQTGFRDAGFGLDMPGHIKHNKGDSFSEVYLSYFDKPVPSSEFLTDFAPDEKFNYTRGRNALPKRMIRGYHLRDRETAKPGPWLVGMTLQPDVVSEAWCHQRGYICMIEEFGSRPIKAGESFSAAFVVGYFDSLDEMHAVYDQLAGHTGLEVSETGWKLLK